MWCWGRARGASLETPPSEVISNEAMSFRGVVHSGVFAPDTIALVVSHPHPSNDYGGGPGPVASWREPSSSEAYRDLVDDDFDPDDASFEVRDYAHVATFVDGAWALEAVDAHGSIASLARTERRALTGIVSYGGSAYALWLSEGETNGAVRAFEGLPTGTVGVVAAHVQPGISVVVGGATSFDARAPSEMGLLEREGERLVWRESLGTIGERATTIAAHVGADGALHVYAAGRRIWMRDPSGTFDWVHDAGADVTFLTVLDDGELVAGTARGDVIAGQGRGVRVVGRVGPIQSAVRWHGALYVTDEERVYRFASESSGYEKVLVPRTASSGDWPSAGRLAVGGDRIWLAGSHDLYRSTDGVTWTPVDSAAPFD